MIRDLPKCSVDFPVPRRASINIREDEVIKRQSPRLSAIERARTSAAYHTAESTGLFTVPKIRSYDDKRGIICFERITNIVGLKTAMANPEDAERLVIAAGRAIAATHKFLVIPDEAVRIKGSDYGIGEGYPEVPLHGDFGTANVFVSQDLMQIIVIDWLGGHWRPGVDASIGPAAIDLGNFLMTLFYRRPFGHHRIKDHSGLARSFLKGYQREFGQPLDLPALQIVTFKITHYFKTELRNKGPRHFLLYSPSLLQAKTVTKDICTNGL